MRALRALVLAVSLAFAASLLAVPTPALAVPQVNPSSDNLPEVDQQETPTDLRPSSDTQQGQAAVEQGQGYLQENGDTWWARLFLDVEAQLVTSATNWFYRLDMDTGGDFLQDFGEYFDDGGRLSVLVESVNSMVVQPVAHALLAMGALAQLLRIVQRSESSGVLPGLGEMMALMVYLVVFLALINNSMAICRAITVVAKGIGEGARDIIGSNVAMTASLTGVAADNPGASLSEVVAAGSNALAAIVPTLLLLVVCLVAVLLAGIVAKFVFMARALQIYAFAMFSPIPLALLGFDATRQSGITFMKSFASLALANIIAWFIMAAFPLLVQATVTAGLNQEPIQLTKVAIEMIACCGVLIYGLVQSGSWAQGILGG